MDPSGGQGGGTVKVKPTAAVPSKAFSTFSLQKTAAFPDYVVMVKPKAAVPLTAFPLPKIAACPDYDSVVKPRWMPRLTGQPDDIKRMWTIVHLAMGCNLQVAYGDRAVGHPLAGDEAGGWDSLREANMFIQAALNSVIAYLAGDKTRPLAGIWVNDKWRRPLIQLLWAACWGVMGDHAAGKLADVDNAMKDVMLVCADLDRHGDSQPSNASPTSLIAAFLKCMTLSCSLWTEAACYMLLNTRQCHGPAVAIVIDERHAAKLQAARCILDHLPNELMKEVGGTLGGLMEDTREVYDLAVRLLNNKKDTEDYTFKDAAFSSFYTAAKTLSETSLEQLKKEGVKTSLADERWAAAAKEGMMIYRRGVPVYVGVPDDLVDRMLEYVNHASAVLSLLVQSPGAEEHNRSFVGSRQSEWAGCGNEAPEKAKEASTPGLTASSALLDSNTKPSKRRTFEPWLRERWAARAEANKAKAAEAEAAKAEAAEALKAAGPKAGSAEAEANMAEGVKAKAGKAEPAEEDVDSGKAQGAALCSAHIAVPESDGKAHWMLEGPSPGEEAALLPNSPRGEFPEANGLMLGNAGSASTAGSSKAVGQGPLEADVAAYLKTSGRGCLEAKNAAAPGGGVTECTTDKVAAKDAAGPGDKETGHPTAEVAAKDAAPEGDETGHPTAEVAGKEAGPKGDDTGHLANEDAAKDAAAPEGNDTGHSAAKAPGRRSTVAIFAEMDAVVLGDCDIARLDALMNELFNGNIPSMPPPPAPLHV